MTKKNSLLTLFLIFFLNLLFGQGKGTLYGTILDEYGKPLEQVYISVDKLGLSQISSHDGLFELSLPAGEQNEILLRHVSYQDTLIYINLQKGEKKKITIPMRPRGEQLEAFHVVAHYDDGFVRIDPKLSVKLPSPTGGAEAMIKMLPGVSSTNELSSQYNVRGGNYDENLVFVNNIQIYRPFLVRSGQQEGLSFVNTDLTNEVEFSAGGFEAKYGDKMSSVLDVEYKKPTRYAGSFSASFLGATAHAEGNVKNVFTYLVGVRYKSNSYVLKSMETNGDYKPNFFDAQMLLSWKLSSKLNLSLLGNFSRNKYLFQPHDRETNFGTISTAQKLKVYFDGQEVDQYENYLGGITLDYKINDKNGLQFIASSYYAKESETYDIQSQYWLSDIEADMGSSSNEIAQETSIRGVGTFLEHTRNYLTAIVSNFDVRGTHLLRNNTLSWGVKAQNEIINDKIKEWELTDSSDYTLPHIEPAEGGFGESVPYDDDSRLLNFNYFLQSQNNLNTYRFTGFIQDTWKIDGDSATRFTLNGGLRFHYWTYNNEFTVSPRLSFIFKPRWKHDWEFRLKTGLYYQPAFYREMRAENGELNPNIKSQRSVQIVAAADYNFLIWRRPFKFTTEIYYKYLDQLIPYTVDNMKIIYSAKNNAVGYATGIDLKLSGEFIEGLESWITLSLMKTAEDLKDDYYYDKDGNRIEPGFIPRPTDQRFAVNLFFQDHIPSFPRFRVHLNFTFASGLPYGAPNTERYKQTLRSTWYRRVDIGFSFMLLEQSRDKMKHKSAFLRAINNAGIYLEVFNLLNTNNISSYFWVSDVTNTMFAVPNHLTGRLINLKFAIDF
ncbi:MAG: TonB-dependent receptor [Bacteroidales bacterium]|nr:TonB-dependent receptor [Bacteroidales bacterium]